MKNLLIVLFLVSTVFSSPAAAKEATYSSEGSDRLIIVETALSGFKGYNDKRLGQMDKGVDAQRSIDKKLDIISWMMGVFTLATIFIGFRFTMLYRQGSRLSRGEATVEAQKEEIRFLKELIRKLLPA